MYKCTHGGFVVGGRLSKGDQLAIYHLRLKVHSRALGRAPKPGGATRRSAVAAAAYRSGERLYDLSQGTWFDYDKPDVIHTEIMSPQSRQEVPWVFDRQTLWNRVEASEKRVDAQLAREIEITLPRELSKDQQVELVRQFVRDQFISQGMVADIAIHRPEASDGKEQPHAHILLTLRRLDGASPTGFAATKERDWNEREDIARTVAEARKRFNDTGLPADHEALEAAEALRNVNLWRKAWAEYANRALADAGSDARIDHRTLEKQGIFRVAEISLGIARHIEKAYDYLKDRVTQWVSIKKRSDLYKEAEHYRSRDPAQLADFVMRLGDMAESFAAQFRKPDKDIPEVPLER
jgi:ATP-dependent exoDNAse (exonuclease V) alpha subunit